MSIHDKFASEIARFLDQDDLAGVDFDLERPRRAGHPRRGLPLWQTRGRRDVPEVLDEG